MLAKRASGATLEPSGSRPTQRRLRRQHLPRPASRDSGRIPHRSVGDTSARMPLVTLKLLDRDIEDLHKVGRVRGVWLSHLLAIAMVGSNKKLAAKR